jgi:hypothetical protein
MQTKVIRTFRRPRIGMVMEFWDLRTPAWFKLGIISTSRCKGDRPLKENWMLPRAVTFGLCSCMTPFMSDRSESHETNDFLGGSSMIMSCLAMTGDMDAIRKSFNQKA